MGFGVAIKQVVEYCEDKISALLGEKNSTWFPERWGSVSDMLDVFNTDAENADISGSYATDTHQAKVGKHLKLDYVCALRREVRKQYISEEGDICTDVTPFRHGVISAHAAATFAAVLDEVVKNAKEETA